MQYIKLEDVQKLISKKIEIDKDNYADSGNNDYQWRIEPLEDAILEINSLPSIDPEEIIENVIAKLVKEVSPNGCMVSYFRELLKEFKS